MGLFLCVLAVAFTVWMLPYFMGIDGIMYAAPVADLAAAVISVWFAAREFQKMGAEKPSKITVGN